jgi:hypothetical protein
MMGKKPNAIANLQARADAAVAATAARGQTNLFDSVQAPHPLPSSRRRPNWRPWHPNEPASGKNFYQ